MAELPREREPSPSSTHARSFTVCKKDASDFLLQKEGYVSLLLARIGVRLSTRGAQNPRHSLCKLGPVAWSMKQSGQLPGQRSSRESEIVSG
jgi:hypothetical protein